MKKIGEYTVMGQLNSPDSTGASKKIQLFDGRFDTGYRVKEFQVITKDPMGSNIEFMAKLTTRENTNKFYNWQNNDQIAWSFGEFQRQQGMVDPENIIVEDLYVYAATTSNADVNYMIVMEKYEFSEWKGALTMATERSED